MSRNTNIRSMEELLESDDEFPDEYDDEVPDIPRYKLDNRFDVIEFPWIENSTQNKYCGTNLNVQSSIWANSIEDIQPSNVDGRTMLNLMKEEQNVQPPNREQENVKLLMKKGVLSKQDILCLRCVAAATITTAATDATESDTTLIWFINFLMNKDLQANYKFLKSCLVADDVDEASSKKGKSIYESHGKKINFNIVVKI